MDKKVLAGVIVLNLNIEFHVNLPIEAVDVVLNTMKEYEDESCRTQRTADVAVCNDCGRPYAKDGYCDHAPFCESQRH